MAPKDGQATPRSPRSRKMVKLSSSTRKAKVKPAPKPPKAGAFRRKKNPAQGTMFRKFYERGDLPCAVEHRGRGARQNWTTQEG